MGLDASNYAVAIPSYQRRVTLAGKTLPLLNRRGVDPARITVFVANAAEHAAYERALPRGMYGQLVIAAPGMGNVRNFINRYYPDGSLLLQIDDDVDDVLFRDDSSDTGLLSCPDLHATFTHGFEQMLADGSTLWGIYPVNNAYFMKRSPHTTDLRYIVGALFGVLNAHAPHCQVTLDDKEDFERTIKHYLHAGKVTRLNDHTLATRYYKEPGGMQVTRTEDRVLASAHVLAQRYPDLCSINNTKANGMVELRLKDQRGKRLAAEAKERAAADKAQKAADRAAAKEKAAAEREAKRVAREQARLVKQAEKQEKAAARAASKAEKEAQVPS